MTFIEYLCEKKQLIVQSSSHSSDKLNREISSLITSLFQCQVFLSGFVHCDPHPANVLWKKMDNGRPQLILLDHGLYKQIDDDFRIEYANLWKGLLMADIQQIKTSCVKLGVYDMVGFNLYFLNNVD